MSNNSNAKYAKVRNYLNQIKQQADIYWRGGRNRLVCFREFCAVRVVDGAGRFDDGAGLPGIVTERLPFVSSSVWKAESSPPTHFMRSGINLLHPAKRPSAWTACGKPALVQQKRHFVTDTAGKRAVFPVEGKIHACDVRRMRKKIFSTGKRAPQSSRSPGGKYLFLPSLPRSLIFLAYNEKIPANPHFMRLFL